MESPPYDIIEYLVAHGAYVEAARIAADRGELRRAIGLYERVWRFVDALPLAVALGDRGLAVRLALDANLPGRATEIADAAGGAAELTAVADAFADRGRFFEAGRTAERAGAWQRAAALYRRASAPLDEARARVRAGELREAGLLYERLIAQGSSDEAASARLALGRLLNRLGRHEEAARYLQVAARTAALRTAALRALCAPLVALGFHGAATEVVERLRKDQPALPRAPEELIALEEAEEAVAVGDSLLPAKRERGPATGVARRFELQRLLGGGATGRVYEAVDTLLGIPVALKMLQLGGAPGDPERQAYLRFAREAEAAGRLRHPNIVTLYDAQASSGLFVFELMAGGTLSERLATSGPLAPAAGRRLALDLLAALGAAHERGIVHRDVKPANVFFDAAGNAKLGDFGGAHLADFGQTQSGGFLGTLAYMSPEQISSAPIGAAADLYALGATLFEALTGRPPFLGPDLVGQHLGEAPPAATSLRATLDAAHDLTLRRALAKAPADRFGSAAEMAEAVAAWPVEAAAVPLAIAAGDASERLAALPLAPQPGDEERELWHSDDARLALRRDARTARNILIEERAQPLDEGGLDRLRRIAAAGGPFVQRVLRLSEDRRSIWYEAIAGEPVALDDISADERRRLGDAMARLPAGAARLVARTPAGPVVLIAPERPPG
ncbi:MAG TPA: serine/threonine-protein kinase [Polyangia bacterium]|jgi:serine/threonine-protein kinase